MPLVNSEAFVIGSVNYKEADRIISFFTKQEGKVSAIARNVRKSKKRFGSSLELLDRLNITYFKKEGREIFSLSSADLFKSIACEDPGLEKIACISFFVELVREFCPVGEPNQDIYYLLCWIHEISNMDREFMTIADIFILKLLHFSGFAPQIENCSSCSEKIGDKDFYFSNSFNGLICSSCIRDKRDEKQVNLGLIKFMEKAINSPFRLLDRIKLSRKGSIYLFDILESYIRTILQKRLKTTRFIKDCLSDGAKDE